MNDNWNLIRELRVNENIFHNGEELTSINP
jgi:hypothetical protein